MSVEFFNAIKIGNLELIGSLIENGVNVNSTFLDILPLCIACYVGRIKVAKLLIAKGANVNATNTLGLTPLHMACTIGRIEMVKLFIENGADVNAVGYFGFTPLHKACICSFIEIAKLLIENGSAINALDDNGFSPLHIACEKNHIQLAKILIRFILLENFKKEKPNYILQNKALSTYWDKQLIRIQYLEKRLNINFAINIFKKIYQKEDDNTIPSLFSLSFQSIDLFIECNTSTKK